MDYHVVLDLNTISRGLVTDTVKGGLTEREAKVAVECLNLVFEWVHLQGQEPLSRDMQARVEQDDICISSSV